MNKELALRWIEALRSGKYKQGKKRLKHVGKYCCLGVLCEIEGIKINYGDTFYAGQALKTWNGTFGEDDGQVLAGLNDDGYTFPEIADIIEKHWEDL